LNGRIEWNGWNVAEIVGKIEEKRNKLQLLKNVVLRHEIRRKSLED
jgi:hypothetical protein